MGFARAQRILRGFGVLDLDVVAAGLLGAVEAFVGDGEGGFGG